MQTLQSDSEPIGCPRVQCLEVAVSRTVCSQNLRCLKKRNDAWSCSWRSFLLRYIGPKEHHIVFNAWAIHYKPSDREDDFPFK